MEVYLTHVCMICFNPRNLGRRTSFVGNLLPNRRHPHRNGGAWCTLSFAEGASRRHRMRDFALLSTRRPVYKSPHFVCIPGVRGQSPRRVFLTPEASPVGTPVRNPLSQVAVKSWSAQEKGSKVVFSVKRREV